eukprot:scaffold499485_cov32-Prasinocladus_malaysianus.AAC.2
MQYIGYLSQLVPPGISSLTPPSLKPCCQTCLASGRLVAVVFGEHSVPRTVLVPSENLNSGATLTKCGTWVPKEG